MMYTKKIFLFAFFLGFSTLTFASEFGNKMAFVPKGSDDPGTGETTVPGTVKGQPAIHYYMNNGAEEVILVNLGSAKNWDQANATCEKFLSNASPQLWHLPDTLDVASAYYLSSDVLKKVQLSSNVSISFVWAEGGQQSLKGTDNILVIDGEDNTFVSLAQFMKQGIPDPEKDVEIQIDSDINQSNGLPVIAKALTNGLTVYCAVDNQK